MKKRLFYILIIAAVLFPFILPTSALAEGPRLFCTAGDVSEDSSCDVGVEITSAEGISMMQLTLYYDPEKVDFVAAEAGTLFSGNLAPTLNTGIPGEIVLTWDSLRPLQEGGTVLFLHMRIHATEPAEINFGGEDDVVLARDDFQPLSVSCSGCVIGKQSQPTPTAKPTQTPVDVRVTPSYAAAQPTPTAASVHPTPTPSTAKSTSAPTVAQSKPTPAVEQPTVSPVTLQPTPRPAAIQREEETIVTYEDVSADESQEPTMQEETFALENAHESGTTQAGTAIPTKPSPTPAATRLTGESNGLTMTETSLSFAPGESLMLSIQEDEPVVGWSSSNEYIATVDDNGYVTAHEEGTALITAFNEDGTTYASCAVTVNIDDHDISQTSSVQEGSAQPIVVQKDETKTSDDSTHVEEMNTSQDITTQDDSQRDSGLLIVLITAAVVCFLTASLLFRNNRR